MHVVEMYVIEMCMHAMEMCMYVMEMSNVHACNGNIEIAVCLRNARLGSVVCVYGSVCGLEIFANSTLPIHPGGLQGVPTPPHRHVAHGTSPTHTTW